MRLCFTDACLCICENMFCTYSYHIWLGIKDAWPHIVSYCVRFSFVLNIIVDLLSLTGATVSCGLVSVVCNIEADV